MGSLPELLAGEPTGTAAGSCGQQLDGAGRYAWSSSAEGCQPAGPCCKGTFHCCCIEQRVSYPNDEEVPCGHWALPLCIMGCPAGRLSHPSPALNSLTFSPAFSG